MDNGTTNVSIDINIIIEEISICEIFIRDYTGAGHVIESPNLSTHKFFKSGPKHCVPKKEGNLKNKKTNQVKDQKIPKAVLTNILRVQSISQ